MTRCTLGDPNSIQHYADDFSVVSTVRALIVQSSRFRVTCSTNGLDKTIAELMT